MTWKTGRRTHSVTDISVVSVPALCPLCEPLGNFKGLPIQAWGQG